MQHSLFQKLTVFQLVDKTPQFMQPQCPLPCIASNRITNLRYGVWIIDWLIDWYNCWPSVKWVIELRVRLESGNITPKTQGQSVRYAFNIRARTLLQFYNVYSIYSFSSLGNTKKVKTLRMRWLCSMMGEVKSANRILAHTAQMT
jgi:hypothetical protein